MKIWETGSLHLQKYVTLTVDKMVSACEITDYEVVAEIFLIWFNARKLFFLLKKANNNVNAKILTDAS